MVAGSSPAGRAIGAIANVERLLVLVFSLVGVAQLVEPRIVAPVVVGSSPIAHPSLIGLLIGLGRKVRMGR